MYQTPQNHGYHAAKLAKSNLVCMRIHFYRKKEQYLIFGKCNELRSFVLNFLWQPCHTYRGDVIYSNSVSSRQVLIFWMQPGFQQIGLSGNQPLKFLINLISL